ncbi:flagellar hook protein FlgE [Profundibacterium mesophilum]|uniref:Flagellar hook protein FlgE n=1 Tax=Profundibacterium mesophilum KAUST100406-0324 TaxID=1037889 RepID=A0A921NR56_9RHOB|nr:flagellar hook protein FlgE [Profundibacterium mesophilum]KAF0674644.1 Flagellar hook protein [Profundibacterium mesophilum KAUST100406-0324]
MSISNAMQTGVSGLNANSTAVGRVSENIANANTDGYRRSFAHMVTQTASSNTGTGPSNVRAVEASDIRSSGALRITNNETDLAVSGNGFFVGSMTPNATSDADYRLTRAGAFRPDENGDLVNAAGLYLSGYPYEADGGIGAVDTGTFADLQTVNLSRWSSEGAPSTAMSIAGNLPSQETGLAEPGAPFLSSAEFFSPLGASDRLQFSFQPTNTADTWELSVAGTDGAAYGTVDITFHNSGAFAGAPLSYAATSTAAAPAAFSFDPATGTASVTVDNGSVPQVLSLTLGAPDSFEGLTQFAGDFSGLQAEADGSATSALVRTEFSESGNIFGVFDDGTRKALYQVPLAEVPNPDGLLARNGNGYVLTTDSGELNLMRADTQGSGKIVSGALEGSNVDVAQELTDLIRIQRAYASNAKIVTTADEMLDETLRLKR